MSIPRIIAVTAMLLGVVKWGRRLDVLCVKAVAWMVVAVVIVHLVVVIEFVVLYGAAVGLRMAIEKWGRVYIDVLAGVLEAVYALHIEWEARSRAAAVVGYFRGAVNVMWSPQTMFAGLLAVSGFACLEGLALYNGGAGLGVKLLGRALIGGLRMSREKVADAVMRSGEEVLRSQGPLQVQGVQFTTKVGGRGDEVG